MIIIKHNNNTNIYINKYIKLDYKNYISIQKRLLFSVYGHMGNNFYLKIKIFLNFLFL